MRGSPASMRVLRPRSAGEAVSLLHQNPSARPFAGGTDFMVPWNAGELNGQSILDLSGVREWRGIHAHKAGLSIGALVTHAELRDSAAVRRVALVLAQAAAAVGAEQIQNRGTIGGNIANASPAGDTFPALAVYGSTVRLVSAEGERNLPFLDVFTGVKRTCLKPGELLCAVEIPTARRPSRQLFRKVGTRAAMSISKLVAAGLLWTSRTGVVEELRFSLGSMAPTVRRLRAAEDFLKGQRVSDESVAKACALIRQDVSPIDDLRSTAEYRMRVAGNLLASFLLG